MNLLLTINTKIAFLLMSLFVITACGDDAQEEESTEAIVSDEIETDTSNDTDSSDDGDSSSDNTDTTDTSSDDTADETDTSEDDTTGTETDDTETDDEGTSDTGTASATSLNLPTTYYNYANIELPDHLTSGGNGVTAATNFDNTPDDNPITDAGATLGRVLFYDTVLSANNTTSCASCHNQADGFSDSNVLSEGFDGGETRRHSMGIANARFYTTGKFFWDERADSLEEQVLMPIQDEVEMGLTLEELIENVSAQDYYPELFDDAFGSEEITTDRIARAMAQFVRSIVVTQSRYDIARAEVDDHDDDFPAFTDLENEGKDLFFQNRRLTNGERTSCADCHASEAFIGVATGPDGDEGPVLATNNGLDEESTDDLGVGETTGRNGDIGKFKTPSLVNIAVTAPYMHDGRFATLEDVIDHYSDGIQNHDNLDPSLRDDGEAGQWDFSNNEKAALLAFLETLTDEELLTDEKYSDPFQ